MKHSIDVVLTRGENLDDLLARAEDLRAAVRTSILAHVLLAGIFAPLTV